MDSRSTEDPDALGDEGILSEIKALLQDGEVRAQLRRDDAYARMLGLPDDAEARFGGRVRGV